MAMDYVLQGVRDHLRQRNAWDRLHCDVQEAGYPPATATQWFVGIDETSVTAGKQENYYLGEEFEVSVFVSRNMEWMDPNKRSKSLLRENPYLAHVASMGAIERVVIQSLHMSHVLRNLINDTHNLPDTQNGDIFITPLTYMGRSTTHVMQAPESRIQQSLIYKGRELRFRGLKRNQSIASMG